MIYDVMFIGGGPAGYSGAEKAAHAGLKTILFEKRSVGGVCLNEGCIPTKTYLYSAKIYNYALHGENTASPQRELPLTIPLLQKEKIRWSKLLWEASRQS